jgi:predicted transcriptional regulator
MNEMFQIMNGIPRRNYSRPKRSQNEIYIDLLRACLVEPIGLTAAIRISNLSWKMVKPALRYLVLRGLIHESQVGRWHILQTTMKGKEAVELALKLRAYLQ